MNIGQNKNYIIEGNGKDAKPNYKLGAGDADGDRKLGSFQADRIQDHVHDDFYLQIGAIANDKGHPTRSEDNDGWYRVRDSGPVKQTGNKAAGSGVETNPRNLAVYIYVKVSSGSFYESIKNAK